MCYYHDSLFTWGRLESHLGSHYDWDRLTSVTNELDSMKWTATFSTDFFFYIWVGRAASCLDFKTGNKVSTTKFTMWKFLAVQHFESSVCFSAFCCSLSRFVFKVAIISHLRWHLLSDEGEVKSLRWLIIISKVPCHAADLNKRVWRSICMHLYAWAKRLMS